MLDGFVSSNTCYNLQLLISLATEVPEMRTHFVSDAVDKMATPTEDNVDAATNVDPSSGFNVNEKQEL